LSSEQAKLDLERIVFIGRTYEEYVRMFGLKDEDMLNKRILDCPGGACSFTATANQKGFNVTACDIAYGYPENDLLHKGIQDIEHAAAGLEQAKEGFVWNVFKNVEELKKMRLLALKGCVQDMKQNPQHYVHAVLPNLPFADKSFDLILSAHFLFTYHEQLDYAFHLAVLKEFLRVARREVRIFPFVNLNGETYAHAEKLVQHIKELGHEVQEIQVPYEFQKGANTMLVIRIMA